MHLNHDVTILRSPLHHKEVKDKMQYLKAWHILFSTRSSQFVFPETKGGRAAQLLQSCYLTLAVNHKHYLTALQDVVLPEKREKKPSE